MVDQRLFVYSLDVLFYVSVSVSTEICEHLAERLDTQIKLAVGGQGDRVELLPLAELERDGQRPSVLIIPTYPTMS